MARSNVFIRVEAGGQVGYGHLIRCIALSHMLKNDFDVHFFSYTIPENLYKHLLDQEYKVSIIKNEFDFFSHLTGQEIVVLDNYDFDFNYQKRIKDKNCKLVCIDDLHDKKFCADLIINHAPGITAKDYSVEENAQFALGLNYALLRPVFLNAALNNISNSSGSLMICFGGSDYLNLTQLVLKVILKNSNFNLINVVIGEGYKETESLKELILAHENVILHRALKEEKMLEVMQNSEYAIVPASGILMECIAVGLKVISGMYVDNQKLVYNNFNKSGAFIDAGDFSEKKLIHALSHVKNFKKSDDLKIDGKSGERINKIFKQLNLEKEVCLRRANIADLDMTYKWAIDPRIRKHSFSKKKISENEHKTWFKNKLEVESCYYYIAEHNNFPVGSIRFDVIEKEAVISFLVDPNHQGKGYGRILLKKGYALLKEGSKNISTVVGYVIPENTPSVKSFLKLGYSSFKEDEGDRYKFCKDLNK
ncbi:UDP-2,4-diacetamido-2,4,6-trideoxy-beta-L-altropyranose hydrolase [Salegentibacter agarivorans]